MTNPATHSAFLWQISLKLSDFCNGRDNKADIKNNTQHSYISGAITKPTQNQVYSRQNHKTNSESSVFKPKSQNQLRIKCIEAKISIAYLRKKKSRYQKQYPSCRRIGKITINTSLKFITNNLTL